MFIPFVSSRRTVTKNEKRKGGGGGGGHGGGRGSGGGRGGSSVGGKGGGTSASSNIPGSKSTWSNWGTTSSGPPRPFANGVNTTSTIPSGSVFAGRNVGGGTRGNVYGSSGYPGIAGRGVAGRGFPFFFWPLSFGAIGGAGVASYLHSDEYGRPDNTSRPGGPQVTAAFQSNTTESIFMIVADNNTVVDLVDQIDGNCSRYLTSSTPPNADTVATSYDAALFKPEQVVQYYRASSAALGLAGYNNTAALSESEREESVMVPESVDIPVANTKVDMALLSCLNTTIGTTIDLVDGASSRFGLGGIRTLAGIDNATMPRTVALWWIVVWWLTTLL